MLTYSMNKYIIGNIKGKEGAILMKNNYKAFDVVLVDFGNVNIGGEQAGKRPAVIIQNTMGNLHSPTTIVLPFTTVLKHINQPTHSLFTKDISKGLKDDSMLLGECVRQISELRIIKKLGTISELCDRGEVKRVYLANLADLKEA